MPNSKTSQLPWEMKSKPIVIAVLGDAILDEYIEGDVSRLSPEAPVPVHVVRETVHRAGGAANAALNIQRAGGQAVLFSVCGQDNAGADLRALLEKEKIDVSNLIPDKARPTTRKSRVITQNQQIVRLDWERTHPISSALQELLLERLRKTNYDALLISDYSKGLLPSTFTQKAVEIANNAGALVCIDPKGIDYAKYQGAFLITPNRKEALQALGLEAQDKVDHRELAKMLQDRFQLRNILITLGADGMYLLPESTSKLDPVHLPTLAQEVFDVSGAGDTVVAVFALAVAAKAELPYAMSLANLAAGIVVGKRGTQPIERDELLAKLVHGSKRGGSTADKIRPASVVAAEIGPAKGRKQKVVMTNGCFDILHAGHISYLEQARELGNILIVAVNADASVRGLKGPTRPINTCENRMRILAALACVDYVLTFDEADPLQVITKIQPNVLVKGGDWDIAKIVGKDVVESYGGKVTALPLVAGLSTTNIVEKISQSK